MRVKLLANLGSNDFPGHPYLDGETHDVPDDIAAKLVRRGFAEEIEVPAPEPEPVEDKFTKLREESKPRGKTKET